MSTTVDAKAAAEFTPLEYRDGYLPIAAHGLLGDGITSALVGCDGNVAWLCVPRFDSLPIFCGLLDTERGGIFRLAPAELREARQSYDGETGVLITELRCDTGVLRITDALVLHHEGNLAPGKSASRKMLVRSAQVVSGEVRAELQIIPRGGGSLERSGACWRLRCDKFSDLRLHLSSTRPLSGLETAHELRSGDRWDLILDWDGERDLVGKCDELLHETLATWKRWVENIHYQGPQNVLVRRSAITLKMLDYTPNGAILAAPTSSLPETIGGERNWDYRYAWIRDAAFSVYALRRIGLEDEAWHFLSWVLKDAEQEDRPRVLYNVDGVAPPPEYEDEELRGYRNSQPVRWGNAAADQQQHDVLGETIDCAYQWSAGGAELPGHLWERLTQFVEIAAKEWRDPDHGIWEVRSSTKVFTYSAALCHVALDRAAKLAKKLNLKGDTARWCREADEIREAILSRAWSEKRQALTGELDGEPLDAAVLTLPLRRVVPATHPKMIATTEAIYKQLGAGDGLIYRYLTDEFTDGLEGKEGAFLLCSFWLVDNLALQGRTDEALELYDSLCGRANHLGLLPEQIDASSGSYLGNFPQAFSHVGVIASGVTLARVLEGQTPETGTV